MTAFGFLKSCLGRNPGRASSESLQGLQMVGDDIRGLEQDFAGHEWKGVISHTW